MAGADEVVVVGSAEPTGLARLARTLVELRDVTTAPQRVVVNRMRDKGVLISACAMGHNVLKIRPPLVLSAEQAGLVVHALDEALGEARGASVD